MPSGLDEIRGTATGTLYPTGTQKPIHTFNLPIADPVRGRWTINPVLFGLYKGMFLMNEDPSSIPSAFRTIRHLYKNISKRK